MKIRDPRALIPKMKNYPPELRDFWLNEYNKVRFTEIIMDWQSRGLPILDQTALKYPGNTAFVIGTGPSFDTVTPKQWLRLTFRFSVGVNQVPYQLQRQHEITGMLPTVVLMADFIENPKGLRERFAEPYQKSESLILVSEDVYGIDYDMIAPFPVWMPDWGLDLRFGIPIVTIVGKARYSRTILGAAYLAACLFERVVLIGVDHHSREKEPDEPGFASRAFGELNKFLARFGRKIVNASPMTKVDTLERVDLDEELRAL